MTNLRDRLTTLLKTIRGRNCNCAAELTQVLHEEPTGYLIVGGEAIPVFGPQVKTWHEHGLTFGEGNTTEREQPIRHGILHWTASGKRLGLKGAKQVWRTLTKRGLSVDFVITDEGIIWQFVDPLVQCCAHAGRLNATSIGVEVTGPGWLARYFGSREMYKGTVHGWTTKFIDYTEEQHASVAALADALALAGVVPRTVTTEPYERLRQRDFAENDGWFGHLHCDRLAKQHPKCDPGPMPLKRLTGYFLRGRDND